ncbi:hypothetical protein D3C72_1208430 [compost metagenome]
MVVHQIDPLRRPRVLAQDALHRRARPVRARPAIAHAVGVEILARHQRGVKRGRAVITLEPRQHGIGGVHRPGIPRVHDDRGMQALVALRATLPAPEVHVVAAQVHIAVGVAPQVRRAPGIDGVDEHHGGVGRQAGAAGAQQPADLAAGTGHQLGTMHARCQHQHVFRGPRADAGHVRVQRRAAGAFQRMPPGLDRQIAQAARGKEFLARGFVVRCEIVLGFEGVEHDGRVLLRLIARGFDDGPPDGQILLDRLLQAGRRAAGRHEADGQQGSLDLGPG